MGQVKMEQWITKLKSILTAGQMLLVYFGVAFIGHWFIFFELGAMGREGVWLYFLVMLCVFFVTGMLFADREVCSLAIWIFLSVLAFRLLYDGTFIRSFLEPFAFPGGFDFSLFDELFNPLMLGLRLLSPALLLLGWKLLNNRLGNPEKATNTIWEYLMWVRWALVAIGCFALYGQIVWL